MRASFIRLWAIFVKEFLQLRRDRVTFAAMLMIPVMQMLMFGYAINTDPKHLSTGVLLGEETAFTRSFLAALSATDYFAIHSVFKNEREMEDAILANEAQFVVQIPAGFTRALIRGERPNLVLIADATDPMAVASALAAFSGAAQGAFAADLKGPLAYLNGDKPPYEARAHKRYNPAGLTQYNIIPGLVGTILMMTMLVHTALSVTREQERGTMETLLAMPVRPTEIMIGKIALYALIGAIQLCLILLAAIYLFGVPILGSLSLYILLTMLFVLANLAIGYTFSTISANQMQAMQMSFFFFLPSMLLTGFMFPYRGMPIWAQYFGELLPLTHYIRISRGIMLKGATLSNLAFDASALFMFTLAVMTLAVARFRQTLD